MNVRVVWRQHALGKVDKALGLLGAQQRPAVHLVVSQVGFGAPSCCGTDRVLLGESNGVLANMFTGLVQVSVSVVSSFQLSNVRKSPVFVFPPERCCYVSRAKTSCKSAVWL